jgi:hypothetical protein
VLACPMTGRWAGFSDSSQLAFNHRPRLIIRGKAMNHSLRRRQPNLAAEGRTGEVRGDTYGSARATPPSPVIPGSGSSDVSMWPGSEPPIGSATRAVRLHAVASLLADTPNKRRPTPSARPATRT